MYTGKNSSEKIAFSFYIVTISHQSLSKFSMIVFLKEYILKFVV